VTVVDMVMNAWLHELHKVLGLFIPLIVTNCAILGRAESFASRQPVAPSLWDGFMMGLGFTMALVVLGAAREIASAGTLFANASLLLGDGFKFIELTLIPDYKGFLLMALPPGGFIMLAFIIAGKRLLDRKRVANKAQAALLSEAIPEEIQ
jgi:electron transport complex protein RnfE